MAKDRDTDRDGRGRPAHLPNVARHNTPMIVFVTVCAADRAANTFAYETMHRILREAWEAAGSHKVGTYVLMPDHLHLFCAPSSPDAENVAKWVRYWKSLVTRAVRGRPVKGGQAFAYPVARTSGRSSLPPCGRACEAGRGVRRHALCFSGTVGTRSYGGARAIMTNGSMSATIRCGVVWWRTRTHGCLGASSMNSSGEKIRANGRADARPALRLGVRSREGRASARPGRTSKAEP